MTNEFLSMIKTSNKETKEMIVDLESIIILAKLAYDSDEYCQKAFDSEVVGNVLEFKDENSNHELVFYCKDNKLLSIGFSSYNKDGGKKIIDYNSQVIGKRRLVEKVKKVLTS